MIGRCLAATILVLLAGGVSPVEAVEVTELPLWEGAPEMAADDMGAYRGRDNEHGRNRWLSGVEHPIATLYRPEPGQATGAAVVVFPGGGYGGQAIDKEGHFVANWLAERGAAALVVPYRCGGGEHQHPVPLSDAQRAIRLVRDNASDWGVDPGKVGVMGFSAGGHLAASAATMFDDQLAGVEDSLSGTSARPDFAILVYPVISMRHGVTHGGSRHNLLGEDPSDALVAQMSADERVSDKTPPTLVVHSFDDGGVPIENAARFLEACHKHGVPAEAHLYETGGHGYGMWPSKGSVANWPSALEGWLAARGFAAKP